MSLPTTHASYGSAEFEDDPFSSDWSVTKTLRTSKALSAKIPSRATSSTDGQGTSSNPKSITYTISDFVDVRSTSPPLLDPPSGLSGSIPSSKDFETWISELASSPAIGHSSQRLSRAATDARLLLALREVRREQADQMRRLQESRSLAIHLLGSPFIRRFSEAQNVNLVLQEHPVKLPDSQNASVISLSDDDDAIDQSRTILQAVTPRTPQGDIAVGGKRRRSSSSLDA